MIRGIMIAVALLAAAPALGQDQAGKDTPAKKAAAPKAHGKKAGSKDEAKKADESGSAAWGTGQAGKEPIARKKATAAPKHAAERAAMLRLRSTYRYAVESCEAKGKACDGSLRDDAERRFMDGCLACATRDQCEAERDLIRSGNSKSMTQLCSE